MSAYLIEDIFDVKTVTQNFERVSRIFADSESFKMKLILDINSQIYPLNKGDKFRMSVTKSIYNENYADQDDPDDDAALETESKLANSKIAEYEYVAHGIVYKLEQADAPGGGGDLGKLLVYISFGGLLMQVSGDASNLNGFQLNSNCYALIKRLAF
ncbi:DNA-directed RNA polymerases I, II, and III subunit RPABC3 [Cichlidogyrus casuarinus]|uniref:DNA-directed RNA polymerases I, II, and III subunit RPABC3 n=1 Tax=Cichlidogyrus casuarinus TaxID=1844966 RepID=A0ABD2Q6I3_9PLAT